MSSEGAKVFIARWAADVAAILESLCVLGKARRGPPSAKATAGQAKVEETFLP
jgi:hypothetical protein